IVLGKGTQNVLTVAKILGLGGILISGMLWAHPSALSEAPVEAVGFNQFAFAMVLVFLTYGAGTMPLSSPLSCATGAEISLWRWHPRLGTPIFALATQALIALTLIAVVGSKGGQELLTSLFEGLGLGKVSWEGRGGFETLLRCTAPVFWLFFSLTGISLFIL